MSAKKLDRSKLYEKISSLSNVHTLRLTEYTYRSGYLFDSYEFPPTMWSSMLESFVHTYHDRFSREWWDRKALLTALFSDRDLAASFSNEIRRYTAIGKIANTILERASEDARCLVLAIGDVAYFWEHRATWENILRDALSSIAPSALSWYDLTGQGSVDLRSAIRSYMSKNYSVDPAILPPTTSIIPSYWGTDSFATLLGALKDIFSGHTLTLVAPEASFLSHLQIARTILGETSVHMIPKKRQSDFFFGPETVRSYYEEKSDPERRHLWYITPVWNPTGSRLEWENMQLVIEEIFMRDPRAICIFDPVYLGLIDAENIRAFSEIVLNSVHRESFIFTESLSKTLGMTGIRIGWSWTYNADFAESIRKYTTLMKAWHSRLHDAFTVKLLDHEGILAFQQSISLIWSDLRKNFLIYMKHQYAYFFDFSMSPHFHERDGLYILLKLQKGYTAQELFSETGIIGVSLSLSDGDYVRYSFGCVSPEAFHSLS